MLGLLFEAVVLRPMLSFTQFALATGSGQRLRRGTVLLREAMLANACARECSDDLLEALDAAT